MRRRRWRPRRSTGRGSACIAGSCGATSGGGRALQTQGSGDMRLHDARRTEHSARPTCVVDQRRVGRHRIRGRRRVLRRRDDTDTFDVVDKVSGDVSRRCRLQHGWRGRQTLRVRRRPRGSRHRLRWRTGSCSRRDCGGCRQSGEEGGERRHGTLDSGRRSISRVLSGTRPCSRISCPDGHFSRSTVARTL
jgi:hypothetical protein